MAASQIQGFTTANILEVETNTKAARVTLRPEDVGALGIYSLGLTSGIMAAALAANSPVWSFRWGNSSNLALVKGVYLSGGTTATAFTAGVVSAGLFVARSFSASDTGGTQKIPSGSENKLRTSMGTTLLTEARISSTAALVAGTRTLDANPIGVAVGGIPAVAGQPIFMPPVPLFEQLPGEYPLVLAQNEGLVIQMTVPATGTWTFGVRINWSEIATY